MATTLPTIETIITLRLSDRARTLLAEHAANSGQDLSAVASELIERATTRQSVAEIMAPVRNQVVESGMSDQDLEDLLRGELEAHRREKKATSA